jgi:hypothetical protein
MRMGKALTLTGVYNQGCLVLGGSRRVQAPCNVSMSGRGWLAVWFWRLPLPPASRNFSENAETASQLVSPSPLALNQSAKVIWLSPLRSPHATFVAVPISYLTPVPLP